jgi:uncharacterized repeat protein (TIGR01451 family)
VANADSVLSAPHEDGHEEATVTVTLADLGLEFGAIGDWEASIYAGAEDGDETSGRFTEWVTATNDSVVFTLPADVREGDEASWYEENNTYIRIRNQGDDAYPTFDMVSDPFTLGNADYAVHFDIEGVNECMTETANQVLAVDETAQITVKLADLGGEFGTPDLWQASLYTGTVAGNETSGRFTEWVTATNGSVVFNLPADVRDGDTAPWDDDAYIRVRPVDQDDYPEFDLVGRPFTLTDGQTMVSHLHLSRAAVESEATVTVKLDDIGLDFGAIGDWEASIYAGAEDGKETKGRFTEWVTATNDSVVFTLPADVREGDTASWADPSNTYIRIRHQGDDAYPTFDMVSDPFTLGNADYAVHFDIEGVNECMTETAQHVLAVDETAQITATLTDLGGEFGTPDLWQASLYTGTVAGSETSGRFTEWVTATKGSVVFNPGDTAPWDEAIYIRVRPVDQDDYPEFDLVGRPFTLTNGQKMVSHLHLSRAAVEELAISKTVTPTEGVELNDVVTYTISIINNNTDITATNVTITDPLPANLVFGGYTGPDQGSAQLPVTDAITWTSPLIAAGDDYTFGFTATVTETESTALPPQVRNVAYFSSDDAGSGCDDVIFKSPRYIYLPLVVRNFGG